MRSLNTFAREINGTLSGYARDFTGGAEIDRLNSNLIRRPRRRRWTDADAQGNGSSVVHVFCVKAPIHRGAARASWVCLMSRRRPEA